MLTVAAETRAHNGLKWVGFSSLRYQLGGCIHSPECAQLLTLLRPGWLGLNSVGLELWVLLFPANKPEGSGKLRAMRVGKARYWRKEKGGNATPFFLFILSGLCKRNDSWMGPLDEDLDALWVADKSAAFLQRVNSLNTPHKVNNVRLISCSHSPLSPWGTRTWNKGHSSKDWREAVQRWPGEWPLPSWAEF